MKKNLFIKRILVSAITASALFSMTAIANDVKKPIGEQKGLLISSAEQTTPIALENNYQFVMGTIESIEPKDGYTTITLANDDMGMVCNVQNDAFVINQEDNSYLKISDLKEKMSVAAILDNNSPMTMSIPPMTSGVIGFVVMAEGQFLDLSIYNQELENKEHSLKLNIGEDTQIVDKKGSKKKFTEEDIKDKECIVFYSITTRSIPAQTTPSFVMILSEEEIEDETKQPEQPEQSQQKEEKQPVALREAAERLGYKIHWTGNDKPVILEKEDCKIEIQVGSKICTINNVATQMDTMPSFDDSKIFITSEYVEVLEKYAQVK